MFIYKFVFLHRSFIFILHKKPNLTVTCHISFCFILPENPAYSGRVRFATSDPIIDSALIIMGTRSADEGRYICKVATFPAGNFETEIFISVWSEYSNNVYMDSKLVIQNSVWLFIFYILAHHYKTTFDFQHTLWLTLYMILVKNC